MVPSVVTVTSAPPHILGTNAPRSGSICPVGRVEHCLDSADQEQRAPDEFSATAPGSNWPLALSTGISQSM
jgi:hypothetical protein